MGTVALLRWLGAIRQGGKAETFYTDFAIVANWRDDGIEVKEFVARRMREMFATSNWEFWINNSGFFFVAALTWPLRAARFCPQVLPRGCIFSVRGYALIANEDQLLSLLGLTSSRAFDYVFKLLLGRFGFPEFVVGIMKQMPAPVIPPSEADALNRIARRAWSLKRNADTASLTSHAFVLPALLQVKGASLDARATAWSQRVQQTDQALAEIQSEIDARCFDLYGFDAADRAAAMGADSLSESGSADDAEAGDSEEDEGFGPSADPKALAAELFDWLMGVAFGRFDLRLATGERMAAPEPDPFDPLPVCSPGMLTGEDGLPLAEDPPDYPLAFPADGILVDDADEVHGPARGDMIPRIRSILGTLAGKMDGGGVLALPPRPWRQTCTGSSA